MTEGPKGELKLEIDELGLEAALKFRPDSSAESCDLNSLSRLLMESRLPPQSESNLKNVLKTLGNAKDGLSLVIAKGIAPLPGYPESIDWQRQETPESFIDFENELINNADPPRVFTIKTEKIAKEKVITKAALLPFLPAKKEKTVEYINVEKKKPIDVDSRVLEYFWVNKDSRIGKVIPPRQGKPGKSVYGKPILPIADERPFALGEGLEKDKGFLSSRVSGFLRIGKDWADIIPFSPHEWDVKKSPDGASALLDFTPGHHKLPVPSSEDIIMQAASLGIPVDSLQDAEMLEAALDSALKNHRSLKAYNLSLNRDAEVIIDISEDKLKATLTVLKGRGNGKPLELSMVSRALGEARVKGVKIEKLKADLIAFYKSQEAELRDYTLVTGRKAEKGKPRTLGFRPVFMEPEDAKAILAELGQNPALKESVKSLEQFPMQSVDLVARVKADDEISRLSPPNPGQSGLNVFGEGLPGISGDEPEIELFENVKREDDSISSQAEGYLLVASADKKYAIRVVPAKDALIKISMSTDRMQASIDIIPGDGLGKVADAALIKRTLTDAGIVSGIDETKITEAAAKAKAGFSNLLIAEGQPPQASGGWKLNWLTRLASGAALTKRADGSVDYKNQDRVTLVTAGQAILTITKVGDTGSEGKDVTGNTIPAPKLPGAVELPEWDATIKEEKNDDGSISLFASAGGELIFEKNRLFIDTVQKINGDIGPATGNLKFPGPVAIAGSVLSGFAVLAAGDVSITGSIEASLVSSDGSIRVVEGIKGAKKATVRARGKIEASFAEQAMLMAVDDIVLKSSALMCHLKTNGKLILQGERGNLVGGLCKARNGIELNNLGSETTSRTDISFGQDYLIKDAMEVEEREVERLKSLVLETDRIMKNSSGKTLDEARQKKVKLLKLMEKRTVRLFELSERFEEHHVGGITVRGTAFPGVCIESHGRTLELRAKKSKVVFYFDQQTGHIAERPL